MVHAGSRPRCVSQQVPRVTDSKKLRVWQKAHALALCVDRTRKAIRGSNYTSLKNQIFTAALSIPANIAEGRRKTSEKEFARFLGIAVGSASELESHLIFARDARVISENDFTSLVSQTILVRKMLYALLKRVNQSPPLVLHEARSREPLRPKLPAGSLR